VNLPRALAATLAIAAACTVPGPSRPTPSTTITIPALRCALDVPVGTEVRLTDDGATFTTRPLARYSRPFSVRADPPADPGAQRRSLASDVSVTYTVQTDSGGSGGDEAVLSGALQVGARTFAVSCHDQGEWPGPDPTWCFAWLATIRADPA
jgi:hypothetical protein